MMNASVPNDWRSVDAMAEIMNQGAKHKTMSGHSIRHHVRMSSQNGLAPHVRRVGRKILISESGFYQWINESLSGNNANRL